MTLSITFYDDIKYHRMDFINRDLDFIGNGVVNLTDFPITYPSPASMNLSLGQGIAWVDGYRIPNDSNLVTVTVPPADPTYPRIDIIQIGHDDINQTYSLVVKKGVPAASPIEPGADPNYVKLYAINVAANATSITIANVTDRRSLVPLKVSGVQITFDGAASTGANTFTGNQTAPGFVATSQTAPLQLPSLTSLPTQVGPAGTVCIVNNQWYESNGTQWIAMTSSLPSDLAKTDVAQTFTADQTISANLTVGVNNQSTHKTKAIVQRTDTRSTTENYDANGNLTQIIEKDGTTTVKTTTLTYTNGNLTQVQEVVDGNTITSTLNYDANNNLTGTTRMVV